MKERPRVTKNIVYSKNEMIVSGISLFKEGICVDFDRLLIVDQLCLGSPLISVKFFEIQFP